MSIAGSKPLDVTTWRQAYLAALFETDISKMNGRITDAEIAVTSRARELFQAMGDHKKEKTALDAALQALHVLRGVAKRRVLGFSGTKYRTTAA
jgi:hypothetical protein